MELIADLKLQEKQQQQTNISEPEDIATETFHTETKKKLQF